MELRFVYDRPAAVIGTGKDGLLVAGDIHIGIERKLVREGIRLYSATEHTANALREIADEFRVRRIVLLGDIKDAIMRPDTSERNALQKFFYDLRDYELVLVRGNHDAYLEDIVRRELVDELLFDRFALVHGNRWPSEEAMQKGYLITAHNHLAVSFTDKIGIYKEKAWAMGGISTRAASKRYKVFNKNIKIVIMPAFNDLILGLEARNVRDPNTSPLLKNRLFSYRNCSFYTLRGELIGSGSRMARHKSVTPSRVSLSVSRSSRTPARRALSGRPFPPVP